MSRLLRSGWRWWPLGLLALAIDQLSKEWILRHFALHESYTVLPVFDIVHARNYGAAFSFLDIPGGLQRWLFTAFSLIVSVALIWWLRRLDARTQKLQIAGLMLIVSGALGNVIDRLRHGNVVDFLLVHWREHWFPAFNVADSCITIGAGLILLDALFESRRKPRKSGA
jgi:signal peptidase II